MIEIQYEIRCIDIIIGQRKLLYDKQLKAVFYINKNKCIFVKEINDEIFRKKLKKHCKYNFVGDYLRKELQND